jgi:ABC transporter substrate binding protein
MAWLLRFHNHDCCRAKKRSLFRHTVDLSFRGMRFAFLVPRRILLTALGAAVVARLAPAESRRHIAFLGGSRSQPNWAVLRDGLRPLGYSEENLDITERYVEGDFARLPGLAAELVRLAPEVIVASPPQAVKALKEATSTIPIVMTSVGDPVGVGFIRSLAHPGGNITGLSTQSYEVAEKMGRIA